MRAIVLKKNGNANQLKYTELPLPQLKEGEVLVQAKAIGINPIDLKTKNRKGIYSILQNENPLILGWELSGVVTQSRSEKFVEGDEVFGGEAQAGAASPPRRAVHGARAPRSRLGGSAS